MLVKVVVAIIVVVIVGPIAIAGRFEATASDVSQPYWNGLAVLYS